MIMQCEKIINFLDNTPNQPSKFKTKTWVETNDDSCGTCNFLKFKAWGFKFDLTIGVKSNLKPQALNFKKSSLCNYNDVYMLVSEAIKITGKGAD